MTLFRRILASLPSRRGAAGAVETPADDPICECLRAAIAKDEGARRINLEAYAARIDDLAAACADIGPSAFHEAPQLRDA